MITTSLRASFAWCRSLLWPDWRHDSQVLAAQAEEDFELPVDIVCRDRVKLLLDLSREQFREQWLSCDRMDTRRHQLLTIALATIGVVAAASQLAPLPKLVFVPSLLGCLSVVAYLAFARLAVDAPGSPSVAGFCRKHDPALTEVGQITSSLRAFEFAIVAARGYSNCLARHVNVATWLLLLSFAWLVGAIIASPLSVFRP